MKKDIHPAYYPKSRVSCACGASFLVGSTLPEIHVEICSKCHPFFTGKQKLVDTARRVEKYQSRVVRQKDAAKIRLGRKAKKAKVIAKKTAKKAAEKK